MTQQQFRELHSRGRLYVSTVSAVNSLPSDTDPTQDVPVRQIQFMANGEPINVKKRNAEFNYLSPDKLSTIEKQHSDAFDVLGELQRRQRSLASDIDKYNQLKKIKENE